MRAWLQHHLNPMHIACRLRDCGLPFGWSLTIGGTIGALVRPIIYRRPHAR